jgi:hypothetical protein
MGDDMRKTVVNILLLLAVATFGLAGCGGGGGGTSTPAPNDALLKSVGGYFANFSPDLSTTGATCFLDFALYYDESIATGDIDSLVMTAPDGNWHWTFAAPDIPFKTSSSGKPYIGAGVYYGANPEAFPLSGLWTFRLNLKSGVTATKQAYLHEPGNSADATHQFLYTKEDWTPLTNALQYVAALSRFPAEGFTANYSSANGGSIATVGLAPVRATFLANEPHAYNSYCWLYDANKTYLGYTVTEYSVVNRSNSGLMAANGELSITPALTVNSTGTVNLSNVKYLRIVYQDGAQYAPASYANFDYRSASALVPVINANVN